MEDLDVLQKVKKVIDDRETQISEILMSGSLTDMEHYKYLQGELAALYHVRNELREFFKGQ